MKQSAKLLIAALAAVLLLSGCGSTSSAKQPSTEPAILEISLAEAQVSLGELDTVYPDLERVDMTGCTDYAGIEAYMSAHPQVEVHYGVSLGEGDIAPDTQTLTLTQEEYSYPALMANLKYLRQLRSLHFEKTAMMPDAIGNLRAAYPNLQITYSVDFCGLLCDGETETLDVSGLDPQMVLSQAVLLGMLPKLQVIDLMDAAGNTSYTLEQAAELQKAVPDALLHYSFALFGKTVSTTDEEVSYAGQSIGNQEGALDTLRMALSIMGGCQRFVLDNCKFSNEELAQVRNEFRGRTKVVWRVWFANGGCLTDRKVIRYVYGLYDSNCANLIYCEDAEFIDVGHNEYLKNCDFVSYMTNLKAIILSGSMISDLSPLANCESLEFLEIAYCGYVEDISPLACCENLKWLNIAYTKVEDLSALDELPMEVMVDARSKTSQEEQNRFDFLHPDCLVQHTGQVKDDQPYGYPWRYDENGDPNVYYSTLIEKFQYPNAFTTLY